MYVFLCLDPPDAFIFLKKKAAAGVPGLLQDATQLMLVFNCNELVLFNQTQRITFSKLVCGQMPENRLQTVSPEGFLSLALTDVERDAHKPLGRPGGWFGTLSPVGNHNERAWCISFPWLC